MEAQDGLVPLDPYASERDLDVQLLLAEAMTAHNHHEIFGLPIAGGEGDQEVWWTEAVLMVLSAKNRADAEKRKPQTLLGEAPPEGRMGATVREHEDEYEGF